MMKNKRRPLLGAIDESSDDENDLRKTKVFDLHWKVYSKMV
nr:hypothetical protein [Mycoplasmopsis bovis]